MKQRFLKCNHCGNIVAMVEDKGVPVMCCGQKMAEIILEQWEWLHEFIKTPASYMIEREISNVWNSVVFEGENARSALDDAAITMNQEIERKMESLGMTEYSLPSIEKIESWVNEDE